jgi:adenylate cyclase
VSGERILVVEDNERNMKFVRDVLQFKGYQVVEAVTGEEGVRLASEIDPDLILMDIQLPGINGFEAFEQIRHGKSTRHIPIIALTASVSASDQDRILKAGFDGFEAKPVALQRLVDVVANGLVTSDATEPFARAKDEAPNKEHSTPWVTEQRAEVKEQHDSAPTILVVDDTPQNVKLLVEILKAQKYHVVTADGGAAGLQAVETHAPDLILLDIMMPDIDGYEVCRRIREMEAHHLTPVVMVTALDGKEERVKGIESGADDFLNKPIVIPELVARVRSLLRIKSLHDQVRVQAVELETFNQQLEVKVQEQLAKIQRMDGLKRFLPPQVAEIALTGNEETFLQKLQPHRQHIVVVFLDLIGFTAFALSEEPEDLMQMLGEFNRAMGELVWQYEGTLDRFTGDGMMIFFNDPIPVPDAELRALKMTIAMRDAFEALRQVWNHRGYELGCCWGVASGYATIGVIGFEQRLDYTAMGTVTNLAARLCDVGADTEILVTKRLMVKVENQFVVDDRGDMAFKGNPRPTGIVNLLGLQP